MMENTLTAKVTKDYATPNNNSFSIEWIATNPTLEEIRRVEYLIKMYKQR